jgi:RNA polymerase primary sigma factor
MRNREPNILPSRSPADRPFVDMEAARELVPEVFAAEYNAIDPKKEGSDRPVLWAMVRNYKNDDSIIQRVNDVYGPGTKAADPCVTTDTLQDLLSKARDYRILNAQEEVDLTRRMKLGVAAFKHLSSVTLTNTEEEILRGLSREGAYGYQALFHCNLKLPVTSARKAAAAFPHIEESDVVTYGYMGLQTAIEKFDERKGYKLSTYAMNWIKQSIKKGLAEEGRVISIPLHLDRQISEARYAEDVLFTQLQRDPTLEELAEESRAELEVIERFRQIGANSMASLNQVVSPEYSSNELINLIEDPNSSAEYETDHIMRENLGQILDEAGLSATEKEALCRKYGLLDGKEQSLQEIGEAFGLKSKNANYILTKAREKIRQNIQYEELVH